jgi:hypothetical protein
LWLSALNDDHGQVRRCDEDGGDGGVDGWMGGCPYGGYEWHILFYPPKEARLDPRTGRVLQQTLYPDLPVLAVYNDQVKAVWTGPGQKVGGLGD